MLNQKDLIKKGYTFKSTSDTETLMYSWVEWGQDAINHFNGIFAFAIWIITAWHIKLPLFWQFYHLTPETHR